MNHHLLSQQQQQQHQHYPPGHGGGGGGGESGGGSSHSCGTRIEGMENLDLDHPPAYTTMTAAEQRMQEEELSFYSASENEHGDDNIWGLLSGVGGNIYEWYVCRVPSLSLSLSFFYFNLI